MTVGEPGVARIVGHIRGYADRWTPDAPDVVADRVRTIETNPPIVLDGDVLRVGFLDGSLHRQVGISWVAEGQAGSARIGDNYGRHDRPSTPRLVLR